MNILDDLNDAQRAAVLAPDGPLLMLAGAGSGKTKTLIHRIAYLIAERGVAPTEILAVTFTNKAAGEMRDRILQLLARPNSSRMFPFMGTFHAVCVRVLRHEAANIGFAANFLIYDDSDQLAVIKDVMKKLKLDDKVYSPRAIAGLMSQAKSELISPIQYEQMAYGTMQKMAALVYPVYQAELKKAAAMDFDDLIMQTVELFRAEPQILEQYQNRFRYIFVDEYQDTNTAQYELVHMLATKHKNICVVGDDWQCLPKGSLVETITGSRRIELIKAGEMVKSANGYGETGYFKVLSNKQFSSKDKIISIKTASGQTLRCTPNHLLFARLTRTENYFVYLMHNKDKGYRIGLVKGTRFDGKTHSIGLRVRANQERADKMWIIAICKSRQEAIYQEALIAYKYGIPMLVFYAYKNRSMLLSQEQIDAVYQAINTEQRAQKLFSEIGLDPNFPHFIPQATSRNGHKRLNVNVVLFGSKRKTIRSPWSASRLSINTTSPDDLRFLEQLGYHVRSGRAGTFRVEVHNQDYASIEKLVDKLQPLDDKMIAINKFAFLTADKFMFMPAQNIHVGMSLPRLLGEKIVEDKVTSVKKRDFRGKVYDLDVDKVHNYIASNIVVHNSIYSWRGANYRNILNFERDWPTAQVVRLEQNYRSTQNILDGAHNVILQNTNRSDKNLWTEAGAGQKIFIEQLNNEMAEGHFIIQAIERLIREHAAQPDGLKLTLDDFAILYRVNAQSRPLEETFLRHNLGYRIVGGVRFYARREVKDALSYLRFLATPTDSVSWTRIINLPPRGLGDRSLAHLGNYAASHELNLLDAMTQAQQIAGLTPKAVKSFTEFAELINRGRQECADKTPADTLEYILKRSGYLDWLDEGSVLAAERVENIKELISVAKTFDTLSLDDFLAELALLSDIDNTKFDNQAVTMMTMHAAKGLEFEVVFIVGMEEGLFPHANSIFDAEQLEEERRLCYVGMTRARSYLFLLNASSRLIYGQMQHNPPSRFLADIPVELTQTRLGLGSEIFSADRTALETDGIDMPPPILQIGDRVEHEVFGLGIVSSVDDDEVEIAFEGLGRKRLNLNFAPLKKHDD